MFSGSETTSPIQDLFPLLSCYILGTLILSAGPLSHLLSARITSFLMFSVGSFFRAIFEVNLENCKEEWVYADT